MATLLTIRNKFCTYSGRYDLATTSVADFDTDAGADFFITAGQDMLDRLRDTPKSTGRYFDSVAIDAWYLKFQKRCRYIEEVWVNNSEERYELAKIDMNDLRSYYTGLVSGTDAGEILYYSPAILRGMDVTDLTDLGTFFNYVETETGGEDYNGIVFLPQAEEAYTIEVIGKFYSAALSSNTDESFWTVMHPMVLVWAALYQLEVSYRNSEGAKDWMAAIVQAVEGIDMDVVAEEIAAIKEMEG